VQQHRDEPVLGDQVGVRGQRVGTRRGGDRHTAAQCRGGQDKRGGDPPPPSPRPSLLLWAPAWRKRETEQLGDLEEELSFTLELPGLQPDHQAMLALVGTTMSLSWSSSTLTRQVHLDITEFEEQREQRDSSNGTHRLCALT
jgi:hypothetical protein